MFLTVHATTALVIAQGLENPAAAFIGGLVSHHVLDAIPHGDDALLQRFKPEQHTHVIAMMGAIDIVVMLLWLWFLYQAGLWPQFGASVAAIIGAIMPDFMMGAYLITKNRLLKWNYDLGIYMHKLFTKKPVPAWLGFSIQGIFAIAMIVLVFKLG